MLLALLLLIAPATASAARPCPGADLTPSRDNVEQVRAAALCLLNRERTRRGMQRLSESPQLRKSAQGFSQKMVRESFFDHVSPGGSTLLSRVRSGTGYLQNARTFALGENIAWGSGEYATAAETMDGWMHSSGHRHNILNRRFRHVGIGIALGAPEDAQGMPAATYTVDFGYRSRR
ncbi:MAG TPA: CAP domain-containing protein [Solirubrobacteraceae bacterium]|nr:CAP domain-containing protein [Solirubrobacteraceae bacterium]